MNNFITNSGTENLKKRLIELIKESKELKFLVGFFYFSGIRELYESIKSNSDVIVKVLVGLNVDLINYKLVEHGEDHFKKSNNQVNEEFLEEVKKSLNTDYFDSKETTEQFKFFIELIKNDRLIIRKTINPNHAKLYIFKLNETQIGRSEIFITGSSNLTKPGLIDQNEFNVEISDYGFEKAEQYFDSLWENSIRISEDNDFKQKLINVLEKNTLIREITPFEAYALVLKIYLESFNKKEVGESLLKLLEENGYKKYRYQLDAIEQALAIIEKYNGVILADVVGLGKTIIACAIAKELRQRGVIICPPGLIGDAKKKDGGWNMYKDQFKLYDWEVWSLGDLESLNKYVNKSKDIEVIIIDEAHRFRNEDTKGYELLKNICRDKKVILLTATPFNNKPKDILSLLKLFITPKKSQITLDNNLTERFKSFAGMFDKLSYIRKNYNSSDNKKREKALSDFESLFEEKFNLDNSKESLSKVKNKSHYLAKQIRNVIEPIVIRRNRLDLQENPNYKDEIKELSKVADPIEWFYELNKEQSEFYDEVIKHYFGNPEEGGKFKGAIYRPFEYEIERDKIEKDELNLEENRQFQQQRNLYDIMRRLLVKRFESSVGAFYQSLKNFERAHNIVFEFVKRTNKHILDRDLIENIYEKSDEEIEKALEEYSQKIKDGQYPKNYKVYDFSKSKNKEKFLNDIESDLNLFKELIQKVEKLKFLNNDPKLKTLIEGIQKNIKKEPKRKIVIFSEYADTIEHINEFIENKKLFNKRVLTIFGDLGKKDLVSIYENFDASYKEQKNDYDILLTTDKLSEGFNLNRAGMVINYDIPWNPVRVVQRLGRINRVSKKVFDELYIVNFFPTEKGATIDRSREIAAHKMFLIHNTLGEDSKIFEIDEEPSPAKLYQRLKANPDKQEESSFYTKALNIFSDIERKYPEVINSLNNFPPRVKVAKRFNENELFVFFKKERIFVLSAKKDSEEKDSIYSLPVEEAIEKIKCDFDEKRLELSESFWDNYEKIKEYKEYKYIPQLEQSLERKAKDNLKTLIYNLDKEILEKYEKEILEFKNFLKALLEDIEDYGTLSDYTLRRIVNLDFSEDKIKESLKEISKLRDGLGDDYLEKEKQKYKELQKEIIVAIENQKI